MTPEQIRTIVKDLDQYVIGRTPVEVGRAIGRLTALNVQKGLEDHLTSGQFAQAAGALRAVARGDWESAAWAVGSLIAAAVPAVAPIMVAAQALVWLTSVGRNPPTAFLDDYFARLMVHGTTARAVGWDHNKESRGYPFFWRALPMGQGSPSQKAAFAAEDAVWAVASAQVGPEVARGWNEFVRASPQRSGKKQILWRWLNGWTVRVEMVEDPQSAYDPASAVLGRKFVPVLRVPAAADTHVPDYAWARRAFALYTYRAYVAAAAHQLKD